MISYQFDIHTVPVPDPVESIVHVHHDLAFSEMSEDLEDKAKLVELPLKGLVPILPRMSPRTLKRSRASSKNQTYTKTTEGRGTSPLKRRQGNGGVVKKRARTKLSKCMPKKIDQTDIIDLTNSSDVDECIGPTPLKQDEPVTVDIDSTTTPTVDNTQSSPPAEVRTDDEWIDSPEEAYPVPKTAQQREKTQLARQKQLEEMKAREAAEAREERLLKRKGLWKSPVKSDKMITWKTDLTAVFNYSQPT